MTPAPTRKPCARAPRCPTKAEPGKTFCGSCWAALPQPLRVGVCRAWRAETDFTREELENWRRIIREAVGHLNGEGRS